MSDERYRVWPGPLPLQTMMRRQWDFAFEFMFMTTAAVQGGLLDGWKASDDHDVMRSAINELIDRLFERKLVQHALAWSFLSADPAHPETIQAFIPQVRAMAAKAMSDDLYTDSEIELINETLNVWHDAADGQYADSKVSIFAIAAKMVPRAVGSETFKKLRFDFAAQLAESDDGEPGLVVMPKAKSTKLVGELSHFKDLIGKKLHFTLAGDVDEVRATLRREYPHAGQSIDLLTKDLRTGQPVRMKPAILLGAPGSGKSRLVRRLADLLSAGAGNSATGMFLYRFDASSVGDSLSWAGTARGWGNTTPSVPARAVQQSGKANPMVLIEEIEKSGRGGYNGSIYSAMTPFLERETSSRLRDLSLDAELDLSWCSYLATANDDTTIPDHIRDRFRIVRVPLPRLEHLRPLSRNIMADLAAEADVDPRWMAPLDADEEAVIAKAWASAGMSIRKLQKILAATLEARDAFAMRN